MKRSIVIFDDDKIRLASVQSLINLTSDLYCEYTFTSCVNVISHIKTTQPDVIIMDIEMPGVNGIEGVLKIRQHYPDILILMQTNSDDDESIFQSLRAGANGYILKNISPEATLEAIRNLIKDGGALGGAVQKKILSYFHPRKSIIDEKLSSREREILTALANGLSYKQVASQCYISYNTVNNHVKNIYKKMGVNNISEALKIAYRDKLV